MKIKTAYSVILSLSLCALIGSAGYCSSAGPTTTYDITLLEKQAEFSVVAQDVLQFSNHLSYSINLISQDERANWIPSPVKAKGLISATYDTYGKRYWLIPFKIRPGSKEYDHFAVLGKTILNMLGEDQSLFKIPLKC